MSPAGDRYQIGPWTITYDPPPIPVRECDWHYWHEDDDGAPDGYAGRSGSAPSLADCLREIADLMEDGK